MNVDRRFPIDRVQLALGGLALLLAVVTVGFVIANASLQKATAAGRARIAAGQAAANVDNSLIRMIAKSASENNDSALRALLAENGITVTETKGAAASDATASPATPAQ